MPQGNEGGFGPGIKAWAIVFAYGCNMTQPKMAEWFANVRIRISAHCQVVCNPRHTAFFTTPKNDRLTVLQVLRNLREPGRRLNDEALGLLERCGFRAPAMVRLKSLRQDVDLREAAAVAAYHAEAGHPVVRLLGSDDAPQFKLVTEELALCWVHTGRHFKKLEPHFAHHRKLLERLLEEFGGFCRQLLSYRQAPSSGEAERLTRQFDQLFSQVTGYTALDERMAQTKAKKTHPLMVLAHPEIPLHNHPAELGARLRVRKRDASFGPRTARGAQAWDTFQTLLSTTKKLGVNFYDYIRERIRGAPPTLPGLIALKAQQFPLAASWDTS